MRNIQLMLVCALLSAVPCGVSATTVSFDLNMEFSGATPPAGMPPWLKATFDDGGSLGSVTLTMTATNLTGTEFVSVWMFNLDPDLDPTALSFSSPSKTSLFDDFDDPDIFQAVDEYKADGDGKFDIKFEFATSDGPATRFGAGDAVQYTISGIVSLEATSFSFPSCSAGGHGPFPIAAHVQGIGTESGWISTENRIIPDPGVELVIPEPLTVLGLVMGVGGLAGYIRKCRRARARF